MRYRLVADAVLVVHLAFVFFVVLGGLLALRWPKLAWVHVPAAVWGVWVEFSGWICPLTPLEVALRRAAGDAGYAGDFVDHYVLAALYPSDLTRATQLALGLAVVVLNVAIYGVILRRTHARHRSVPTGAPAARAASRE
ncbi:MAG TPA: DUF2784 domain-containing protein [Casimicrobiaceae bacterium]|jgi:hypothetical protein|nr:DUF2784 domain-containing protein [Casimicrobiaceae bacterium]